MWIIGKTHLITWSTQDFYYIDGNDQPQPDTIKLEISHNGGSTWATIIADTPNTGSYLWTVTGPAVANARIRYSGVQNTGVTAQTTNFAIVAQATTIITVTPLVAIVPPGMTRQFSAVAYDQEGDPMLVQPTLVWSVTGGGSISAAGLFTAGATEGGPYGAHATVGAIVGSASVSVKRFRNRGDAKCYIGDACGI